MPTSEHQHQQNQQPIHPLLARQVMPIGSWAKFLECWSKATTMEEMLGLLHVGFTIPYTDTLCAGELERILFYLRIADGWSNGYALAAPDEAKEESRHYGVNERGHSTLHNLWELRRIVAQKAFDVLVLSCFRGELRDERILEFKSSWHKFASEPLAGPLMKFFRIERHERGAVWISNLQGRYAEDNHQVVIVEKFLLNLARYLWGQSDELDRTMKEVSAGKERIQARKKQLDALKPWMVEILLQLKDGVLVLNEMLMKLDEACLDVLKKEALRATLNPFQRHAVRHERPVTSIEEACYAGSRAAWLFKLHEINQVVSDHLVEVLSRTP